MSGKSWAKFGSLGGVLGPFEGLKLNALNPTHLAALTEHKNACGADAEMPKSLSTYARIAKTLFRANTNAKKQLDLL